MERQLLQELERVPSIKELSIETNLSTDRIRALLIIAQEPISTDITIGDNDEFLGDSLICHDQNVEDEVVTSSLNKMIQDLLEVLMPTEKKVITLRYGLDGKNARTLEEVGNQFGFTRERVRQIETKALRKLKRTGSNLSMNDYL